MADAPLLGEDLRLFLFAPEGAALLADVVAWARWRAAPCATPDEQWAYLEAAFRRHHEFRSLLDFRLRGVVGVARPSPSWPRANDLHIYCESIGGGFRIQHGHSTWVVAERIGANFHVNQNVTVGVGRGGKPTIGDNVRVWAGAVVTGAVRIGDNVSIAPNTFVNFDVPDDTSVFPAPPILKSTRPPGAGVSVKPSDPS